MHLNFNAVGIGLAVAGLLGVIGQGTLAFVALLVTGVLVLAGL